MELIDPLTLTQDELMVLYKSVGWTAYTRAPEELVASVRGSHRVATARFEGALIGLARSISDGVTIAYLQDVLVHPDFRLRGIGALLVRAVFQADPQVRQRVLLTDADPGVAAFYTSMGFTEPQDHQPPLRAFVRLG